MTDLSPETVGKLVALVRNLAVAPAGPWPLQADAKALVAELPEPVDPDLVEARKVCEEAIPSGGAFLSGEWDIGDIVTVATAAIKRGRALAAGDRS